MALCVLIYNAKSVRKRAATAAFAEAESFQLRKAIGYLKSFEQNISSNKCTEPPTFQPAQDELIQSCHLK